MVERASRDFYGGHEKRLSRRYTNGKNDNHDFPGILCDPVTEWKCADGRKCIDKRRRCDGYPDCADVSDEDQNVCPNRPCDEDWQFQCSDKKKCIDNRRRCDGHPDCLDKSDEMDCLNGKNSPDFFSAKTNNSFFFSQVSLLAVQVQKQWNLL